MSDQTSRENLDGEYGTYSLDDEDQLQPEDTLDGSGDPLDQGYQTADRLQGTTAWGTTAEEQRTDETINQRIGQEVPDPHSAYGAPDNESGLDRDPRDRVGGDDPDSIPADQDWVGDSAEGVGRLVAPDEGNGPDLEKDMVASNTANADDSPEGAAMHYVDEDDLED
ncbi:DUF5709 domain-containing protein [Ornithinimicrobium faecis]|uniref:DUF5709 domain-containing protein n=1 Tax=Ornithinimicrobium faecis TaxID=2934158 RepID=A0ABY4YQ02_9MICO|nr:MULTISPECIES: DUF5709 domain-containing protein [unclassified Ornithinimicrobium]USQ78862.1 DUF5709 domain-containing protein [Ornithinimicrobium sp. HY1793]